MERSSGIMLHISSLPNKFGFGCFSKEAYEFVDFLHETKTHYWQILPLNPTNESGSPFQCFSVFAGNICFIDLTEFLNEYEIKNFIKIRKEINFSDIYEERKQALKFIYKKIKINNDEILKFKNKNRFWIDDFALFMTIKDEYKIPLLDFKKFFSSEDDLLEFRNSHKDEINFYIFTQYIFFNQWMKLKKYANDHGVKIIGDIAFYPALDSADVFSQKELFCFDKNGNPSGIAGVPPDYFCEDGQLWGNPVYNMNYLKKTKYSWWFKRFEQSNIFYDVIRIDHFRGFEAFYEIPFDAKDAKKGKWKKGFDLIFFKDLEKKGIKDIIVEDLGIISTSARKYIEKTGFPTMRVFQFAFDGNLKNIYYPHNYVENCVAYLGTHDNNTFLGFLHESPTQTLKMLKNYLNLSSDFDEKEMLKRALFVVMNSLANLVVLSMQDILELDEKSRMNTPGTVLNNWKFRINNDYNSEQLKEKILKLNISSNRC